MVLGLFDAQTERYGTTGEVSDTGFHNSRRPRGSGRLAAAVRLGEDRQRGDLVQRQVAQDPMVAHPRTLDPDEGGSRCRCGHRSGRPVIEGTGYELNAGPGSGRIRAPVMSWSGGVGGQAWVTTPSSAGLASRACRGSTRTV